MKKRRYISGRSLIFIVLYGLLICQACRTGTRPKAETVTVDDQFRSVFYSDSGGITGADGLFSFTLPDGSSLFLLGDCFLGVIKDGARDLTTPMLRNAFNLINKDEIGTRAIFRGTIDAPQTLMEPVNEPGDSTYRWYWPGHGFVRNDTIYVFALSLVNDTSVVINIGLPDGADDKTTDMAETIFSFRISNIDLLSFSYPDFRLLETHRVEIDYPVNQIDFGNCVMIDEGYVYIYGTKNLPGKAEIYAARVPFDSRVLYRDWEYSTGDGWEKDISRSVSLDINISVSEQFSIFRYGEKYILLTQERAGSDIYTYISDYPDRDFHNRKFIYHTPEPEADTNKRVFTYNALAHRQYIVNNRLLVTYCVNSLNPWDIFEDVEKYRARFIRVPMKLILREEAMK
ncbi:MAG: hypothetical protein GX622_09450 [Bacteroidales bacterium]|nr:hypothetical protein [Bacteroidales bacterium]